MISRMFDSTAVNMLQEVVDFSQSRHTVLAGNIANINTPGYRSRDLSVQSFQDALRKAFVEKEEPREYSPGRPPEVTREPMKDVHDAKSQLLFHDGTNMDIERQVLELTKNQSLHSMAVSLLNHQFKLLETAVSERV